MSYAARVRLLATRVAAYDIGWAVVGVVRRQGPAAGDEDPVSDEYTDLVSLA